MLKYATQHLHQNCLCTLTSSYRHLANSYTLLLNASILLTQYVGLVWNPPTHLSVCHSAIAYRLRYITAMVERIPLRPNIQGGPKKLDHF